MADLGAMELQTEESPAELTASFLDDARALVAGALFTAAGMAHVNPWNILPGFAIGKFLGDAWVVFAGKVTAEASGLVVVTWSHDGHELDTGFRPRRKADTAGLTESISTLIGAEQ